jgi:hypothetical protein
MCNFYKDDDFDYDDDNDDDDNKYEIVNLIIVDYISIFVVVYI